MKSIELNTEKRHAWLRELQDLADKPAPDLAQSDFEKSLAFRLTFIVVLIVIGINIFAPPPTPAADKPAHALVRPTV